MLSAAEIMVTLGLQGVQQFAAGLGQASSGISSFGEKVSRTGKIITASVTTPIVAFGVKSVMAASDVNEAQSAVNTVFGDSSKIINDYTKNSAQNLGVSREAALSAAAGLGALYSSVGVTGDQAANFGQDLLGAAADLGSFYNVDPGQVLNDLKSGLVGEAEPLRKYGILLDEASVAQKAMAMTGKTSAEQLTQQEKVMARQVMITESLGKAQGDFARTSGGLANQMRIAKASFTDMSASIGQLLLPYVLKATSGLTRLFQGIMKLSPGAQKLIVIFGLVAAAIGPLLIVIGTLAGALGSIAGLFGAGGAMAGILTILGPITLVIGALALLGVAYKTNFLGFGDAVNKVAGWVADGFGKVLDFIGLVVDGFKTFQGMTDPVTAAVLGISYALGMLGFDDAALKVALFSKTVHRVVGVVMGLVGRLSGAFKKITGGFGDIFKAFKADGLKGALKEVFGDAGRKILAGFGDALGAPAKAIGEFLKGIKTGFDPLDRMLHSLGKTWVDFGRLIQEVFQGDWSGALEVGKRLLGHFTDFVSQALGLLWSGIKAGFEAIDWGAVWDVLKQAGTAAWDALKAGAQALWDEISNINWASIAAGISDFASGAWDAIKTGLSLAWDAITALDWDKYIGKILDFGGWLVSAGMVKAIEWGTYLGGKIADLGSWFISEGIFKAVDLAQWLGPKISSFAQFLVDKALVVGASIASWLGPKIEDFGKWLFDKALVTGASLAGWLGEKIPDFGQWLLDKSMVISASGER